MLIMKWEPHAECSDQKYPPELSVCKIVLDKMPASTTVETFGAQGTENIDVSLPVKYSDRQSIPCSSCYMSSSTNSSYSEFCLHNRGVDKWTASNGRLVQHMDRSCVDSSNMREKS